ncbi:hypothetical protein [Marinitoga lauensis]|uniref:hypothetical protein n=1 Tax=Marinitoga lauensis TaxID=2201189 RepID=UPI0010103A69|nr:hypothetical protein [Marinitoga lauensis]
MNKRIFLLNILMIFMISISFSSDLKISKLENTLGNNRLYGDPVKLTPANGGSSSGGGPREL